MSAAPGRPKQARTAALQGEGDPESAAPGRPMQARTAAHQGEGVSESAAPGRPVSPNRLIDSPRGPRPARTPAGAFIGGAKGRLLPASIPLRFFGAAVLFHLLAWLALAVGSTEWTGFGGALGWPLAALHLITLGTLGMSVLGAGAQLLPVASRQSAPGARLLAAVWWLAAPGVAVLALGMGLARPVLIAAGAAPVVLALAAWGVLMARNLHGARGMPGVVGHGWAALASLLVLLLSALSLLAVWLGLPAPPRDAALALHRIFAPYGFIGMLSLGLSYVLVPMFVLSDTADERWQLASLALAAAALLLAALAAFGVAPRPVLAVAIGLGAGAVALHLWLIRRSLRTGMRRLQGPSWVLVCMGWAGLALSLALALSQLAQLPLPRANLWFGLCLIGLWQLSFLLGMLQRIAPFLAAMHGATGRRARTPSALTHDGALRLHLVCHCGALALLALALATDSPWPVRAAAALGTVGAIAFGVFYVVLLQRMQAPKPTNEAPPP